MAGPFSVEAVLLAFLKQMGNELMEAATPGEELMGRTLRL